MTTTLRKAVISGRIVPILAGSALQNVAVNRVLDAICDYLPLPKEKKVVHRQRRNRSRADSAPLAALVFKTTADPYVGKLTYFRVYNGVIDQQLAGLERQPERRLSASASFIS